MTGSIQFGASRWPCATARSKAVRCRHPRNQERSEADSSIVDPEVRTKVSVLAVGGVDVAPNPIHAFAACHARPV